MSKKPLLALAFAIAGATGGVRSQDSLWALSMQELFRIADEHNTSIKSLETAISVAQAGEETARAARLPDIEASASVSYLGNGRIMDRNFTDGMGVSIPHYGNNFALKAQWAVYTGGAIRSGMEMARLRTEMSRVTAQNGRQDVRFLLAGLYLQLHCLHNQRQVYAENIELCHRMINQTSERRAEGLSLKNDITRQELQLEQLKLGLTEVVAQEKILTHQLLTALGKKTEVKILTADVFEYMPGQELQEAQWQSEAHSAPLLQLSELGISMNRQKERMERSALLPKVALVAEEHLDGPITFEIPNIDKNFNYWFVGLGVKYNFGALYKDRKRLKEARLATRLAQNRHTEVQEQIETRVQAGYTQYVTSCTSLQMRRKSVRLAEENYGVMEARYANGLVLVTDMIDAANERLNAQLAKVNAQIDVMYNFCNLKHITGTLGE